MTKDTNTHRESIITDSDAARRNNKQAIGTAKVQPQPSGQKTGERKNNSLWGLEQNPQSYMLLSIIAVVCSVAGICCGHIIGVNGVVSGMICGFVFGFFVGFGVKTVGGINDRIIGGVIYGIAGSCLGAFCGGLLNILVLILFAACAVGWLFLSLRKGRKVDSREDFEL